jgi:dihydrofolate reductase
VTRDFATLWRAADKVVFSKTLATVSSANTRLERSFDADAIRRMKSLADRDISVGGPNLATQAFRDGLIDECHLFLTPIIVGGGNHAFPTNVRLTLDLLDKRRFGNGVVHLHYGVRN